MNQPTNSQQPSNEASIQLALLALQQDAKLSIKRAAQLYNVPRTTLADRRAGKPSRRDCQPNSLKLTKTEEQVLVEYILDLDSRGFPPRLAAVRDMADSLLAARSAGKVGKNWPNTFVQRTPELEVKFNRKYDYQRALCEDSGIISAWFRLVENIKMKYGIADEDTYNFDESGFMLGVISTGAVVTGSERRNRPKQVQPGNRQWATVIACINAMGWAIPPFILFPGQHHLSAWYQDEDIPHSWTIRVTDNGWTTNKVGTEWLEHFDTHTKNRVAGAFRLLILDGHKSHDNQDFKDLCKEKKIITICMPSHSSHLLQPLDVGCFSPLKKAYGRQVEALMRCHINHITKIEFLPCFKAAFVESFTKSNILGSFRGAGLVPFDPEAVLSKLEVRLRTPTPPTEPTQWESKTPSNPAELQSQSTLIRSRIQRHFNSSPIAMVESLNRLTKGAEMMAHSVVLMRDEIKSLRVANEAATRRKSHKRKRIQKDGALTVEEGARLTALREFSARSDGKSSRKRVRADRGDQAQRRCGRCNEIGHNLRTCKSEVE